MSRDYMPQTEEKFFDWQKTFTEQVTKNLAAWNIPTTATDALVKAKGIYDPAYAAANLGNRNIRTPQQTLEKNEATVAYKKVIRKFVRQWLAFNDAVTNGQKLAMGITVTDAIRTASGPPKTIPNLVVVPVPGSKLKITFKQAPDGDGISHRGKPEDAGEIEIAAWVGTDAPVDGEDCIIKNRYTKSPVYLKFDGEDAGKTASIFARWIGKAKQPGDWSNAIQEVISK